MIDWLTPQISTYCLNAASIYLQDQNVILYINQPVANLINILWS